jgi:hypothetical protein
VLEVWNNILFCIRVHRVHRVLVPNSKQTILIQERYNKTNKFVFWICRYCHWLIQSWPRHQEKSSCIRCQWIVVYLAYNKIDTDTTLPKSFYNHTNVCGNKKVSKLSYYTGWIAQVQPGYDNIG